MAKKIEQLKGKVMLLHNKNGVRAFDLRCDMGYFRIVDYTYDPLDREIYWAAEIIKVNTASEEYDVAGSLIDAYIRGIYDKLSPENRKKWPLV